MDKFELKHDKKKKILTIEGINYSEQFFKGLKDVSDGKYLMIISKATEGMADVSVTSISQEKWLVFTGLISDFLEWLKKYG